jgi:hypothetical protein
MSQSFKLARRFARLRIPICIALVSAFSACDGSNTLDPTSSVDPQTSTPAAGDQALGAESVSSTGGTVASANFAGGIPFGSFAQPVDLFGALYTGGKVTVGPEGVRNILAGIKARGGRVVLMMAGAPKYYRDASGHFSLSKWQQRIDRYRNINLDSYVQDGTIVAHFLLDEPQDPSNWNGRPVTQSEVEAMGAYSKRLWPSMPTAIRTLPKFFSGNPKNIDAAWAQYLTRFGNINNYVNEQVAAAKSRGLALIVGLNVLDGGARRGTPMTASELKTYGGALLSNSYPCAFVSWQYRSAYYGGAAVKDAMQYLSGKAKNHASKSCRGS